VIIGHLFNEKMPNPFFEDKHMKAMENFSGKLANWFNTVSLVALVVMLAVLVIDILGGKLFHRPISGSIDILGLLGLFVFGFALARTEILGSHIRVDFLTLRLSSRLQNVFIIVSSSLTLVIMALIIFTCVKYALMLQDVGGGSQTLEIPYFPFVYVLAFAFIPLMLQVFVELLSSIMKVRQK